MYGIINWIEDIEPFARSSLRQANYSLRTETFDIFLKNIEASISYYFEIADDDQPLRKSHNALRKLWQICHGSDPPVGVIRKRVLALSGPAKDWLLQRGSARRTEFLGEEFSEAIFDKWVQTAKPSELVKVIKSLVSEGGMMLDGRKDRRAKRIFEPMIMGVVRGKGDGLSKGGRPKPSAADELVMYLAIDWAIATGKEPHNGRSDSEGFSGLVHQIFDTIGIESSKNSYGTEKSNGAEQALRRYWAAVETYRNESAQKVWMDPHSETTTPNKDVEPKG